MRSLAAIFLALNAKERIKFFHTVFVMAASSLMESFALMLLIPYIGTLSGSEESFSRVESLLSFAGLHLLQEQLVLYFSLFFGLIIVVKSVLQLRANYLITAFPFHYYRTRTGELFDKYLSQDYISFVNADVSALLKHCNQTTLYATEGLYQQLQLLSYSFVILFIFALLLFQDFWGSLGIIFLFSVLGQGIYSLYKKPIKKMGKELVDLSKQGYRLVTESLRSFKETRLYGKGAFFSGKFDAILSQLSESYRKTNFYALIPNVLTETMALLILIIIVLVMYKGGRLDSRFVATLILYAAAGRRVLPAINQVVSLGISLQHREESFFLLQRELGSYERRAASCSEPLDFENSLEFCHVDFSYDGRTWILNDLSLKVAKNSSVAFVGPSGGGKSTIANLLIGLLEPTGGCIRIDGDETASCEPVRHLMGYVPQSIFLLNESIAANIAFGEERIDTQKLQDTIRTCHLKEFIDSLPCGVDTIVGDQGIKLSGGQRQRIGIARALYRQPEIMVFDEATASLDTLSEMVISESIREMMGKKTLVAIAHRLSTIKDFDVIYVLDRGRIVASGKHEELLRTCDLYCSMVEKKEPALCAE